MVGRERRWLMGLSGREKGKNGRAQELVSGNVVDPGQWQAGGTVAAAAWQGLAGRRGS